MLFVFCVKTCNNKHFFGINKAIVKKTKLSLQKLTEIHTMSTTLIQRLRLSGQITRGLFLTDRRRTVLGRVWQLFSRFTWELPQTLSGWLFTLVRALVGQVDRVDALGGITFAIGPTRRYGLGVSLGTFVDLWAGDWMSKELEGRITESQFCMHEFGHTADSQRFGLAYIPVVGLASLMSALGTGNHNIFWTEIRANCHAKRYFGKHFAVKWDESSYPTK